MDHIKGWRVVGMSAVLLSLNTVYAQSVPQDMVVRIYNSAGLPRRDMVAAEQVADRIFRRAGILLRWRECRTAQGPSSTSPDPCEDVLQPREVIVRIATGIGDPATLTFGYALVDSVAGTGTLATIYADRITAAAMRLRLHRATLVGRTLAHELGHLLLGTNSHAVHGLMRAWWFDTELRRDRETDWRFQDHEVKVMNVVLAHRTHASPGAPGALAQGS